MENNEIIMGENNVPAGYVYVTPGVITYYSYRCGPVGHYQVNMKKYYRDKAYPGHPVGPVMSNTDYGAMDVIYWQTH